MKKSILGLALLTGLGCAAHADLTVKTCHTPDNRTAFIVAIDYPGTFDDLEKQGHIAATGVAKSTVLNGEPVNADLLRFSGTVRAVMKGIDYNLSTGDRNPTEIIINAIGPAQLIRAGHPLEVYCN